MDEVRGLIDEYGDVRDSKMVLRSFPLVRLCGYDSRTRVTATAVSEVGASSSSKVAKVVRAGCALQWTIGFLGICLDQ
jgi:hypothetical protein